MSKGHLAQEFEYDFRGVVFSGYVYPMGAMAMSLGMGFDPHEKFSVGFDDENRGPIFEAFSLQAFHAASNTELQIPEAVVRDRKPRQMMHLHETREADPRIEKTFRHVDMIAAKIAAERAVGGHVLRRAGDDITFVPQSGYSMSWEDLVQMAVSQQRFVHYSLTPDAVIRPLDVKQVLAMFSDFAGIGTNLSVADVEKGGFQNNLLKGLRIVIDRMEVPVQSSYPQKPRLEASFAIELDGVLQPSQRMTFANLRAHLLPVMQKLAKEQWDIELQPDIDAFCAELNPANYPSIEAFILTRVPFAGAKPPENNI